MGGERGEQHGVVGEERQQRELQEAEQNGFPVGPPEHPRGPVVEAIPDRPPQPDDRDPPPRGDPITEVPQDEQREIHDERRRVGPEQRLDERIGVPGIEDEQVSDQGDEGQHGEDDLDAGAEQQPAVGLGRLRAARGGADPEHLGASQHLHALHLQPVPGRPAVQQPHHGAIHPLAQMTQRLYIMTSITKQNSAGQVTMQCKDVLTRLEERQAQVPTASPGVLYADITSRDTSFEVANAVEADYEASGTLRIGDELMTYTARATSTNGVEFTGVTRGTDNTQAEDHEFDASVQQCIRYDDAELIDVLVDLLQTRGGLDAAYMADFVAGQPSYEEVESYLSFARVTRVLTEPYGVAELVSDLAEQVQFFIWWDETEQLVRLKSIRGFDEQPDTLTDEANIISGTFSWMDKPKERASQVWVYYGQRDFTESDTNVNNYEYQYVIADLESETDDLYGSASIRKIFGTWLSQGIIAQTTATKLLNKYVDTPTEGKFRVDIKDGDYQIGDTFYLSHYLDVDGFGARQLRPWTVMSREEVVPNEIVEYVVEETGLYGRIYFVMASGSADYDPNDVSFKSGYIGNADGVLSDGTTSARIG